MKRRKRNSMLMILIFILALALGAFTTIHGVGKEKRGTAKNIKLGLDLAGGVSITYEIAESNPSSTDVDDTMFKLQKRVDAFSKEGEVYRAGNNRIGIEIPGETDAAAVLEALGKPGDLEFMDEEQYEKFMAGEAYEPTLTGGDIKNASAGIDDSQTIKDYIVQLTFTEEGSAKFAEATTNNIGKRIYIIYDGNMVSNPTVQTAITGGTAQITHMRDYDDAEKLATTIRIGALPLTLVELNSSVVGAKLGEQALSSTLKAGVIGIAAIAVFMIVIYLLPGFVSAITLSAYTVLTLLFLNLFDVTLTLPGLAGIVLSIGMAVDANVIIFTRIREEIGAGVTVKNAIDLGFHKALSAILDGNITTLIAAGVLYIMGTGSIKGFAQTLTIGIILSMFTALIITKSLLKAVFTLGFENPKLYGKKRESKVFDYLKISKYCGILSIALIILGFVFLPINKSSDLGQTLNYSLEFTGGTAMNVEFEEYYDLTYAEQNIAPVIAEVADIAMSGIQIQNIKNSNQIVFKTKSFTVEQRAAVEAALKEQFGINFIEMENISSTMSTEMQRNAILSVVIASFCMLLYIAFRFSDVKFGVSAVIALLHDVFIVFTLYAVARLSVGNTFIACMLTIVGYSINATIIIFDRIRENLKIMNVSKVGYAEVVNTSISQTFTRTIYTSLTTFISIFILCIMGVPSIREFAVTLMAGIICGAYSSVCITGPLWFLLKTKLVKKEEIKGKGQKNKGKKA